jgi:hypothetical protein
MKPIIKVGFCVAYDWELLKKSIPRIYQFADIICLALDKNRRAWSGEPYSFDNEAFYQFIKTIDIDKKIDLYEDDFALAKLNSRDNGNRHRMLIAQRMGKGGWHIQIDSDEYFIDFGGFVNYLKKLHPNPSGNEKPLNVCANWISLLRKTGGGYVYVDFNNKLPETAPFATNVPQYERARHNGHFNITSPFYVLHETWARSEDELWFKINNWGHSVEELDAETKRLSYYHLWQALDAYNYQYVHNFHPANPSAWPALGFVKGESIEEFLQNFTPPSFPLSAWQLTLKNNRNVARLQSLWRNIIKKHN